MADFQMMYFRLFSRVTDAIMALQKAQRESEDLYIESPDIQPQKED